MRPIVTLTVPLPYRYFIKPDVHAREMSAISRAARDLALSARKLALREISRMVSANSSKSRTESEMVVAQREKFLAQREKLIDRCRGVARSKKCLL